MLYMLSTEPTIRGIVYKDGVFSVLYLHEHPFYLYVIKIHLNHTPDLYDHWLWYIMHKKNDVMLL